MAKGSPFFFLHEASGVEDWDWAGVVGERGGKMSLLATGGGGSK